MTQDSSCAKESHKDETSDLDLELDSLRRKLESVSTLVVMNQLIIYLDFCNNCQCFLLFTRLTWSLKILKERCRHWKGKLHTKQNLILLSLRYKSCLKTNLCRKILKVRHSIHYLVVEYKKKGCCEGYIIWSILINFISSIFCPVFLVKVEHDYVVHQCYSFNIDTNVILMFDGKWYYWFSLQQGIKELTVLPTWSELQAAQLFIITSSGPWWNDVVLWQP